jgi:hypothetical protein
MNIRQYIKPSIIIPILAGILFGPVLFILGEADDAPGLCLIGLVLMAGLVFLGLYNTKMINKYLKPSIIIPILTGTIFGSALLVLGEENNVPVLCIIGIVLCIGLLYLGIHNMNKINVNLKPIIILPLMFGTIGILYISRYLIRGVFDEPPGLVLIGILLSTTLLCIGITKLIRTIKRTSINIV